MRVGFNYVSATMSPVLFLVLIVQREGLTLHDITYDGRSVFYRLSLSEMFVPYGDSRAPYPRKGAFDWAVTVLVSMQTTLNWVSSHGRINDGHPF